MTKINPQTLIVLLLAALAVFFSFYRLADFYFLDFDQERDYQVLSELIYHQKPTLIGPRAVSSAGFYLGPWYYYLLAPFFFIFNGHPLYAAFVAGLLNTLTIIALYFFLKSKTNHLSALTISLFWLSVLHRTAWNVSFLPLIVLGILYFLTKPKQTLSSLISLIFLLSLGLHFHFQIILFYPFVLIYFFLNRSKIPKPNPRLILFGLLAFIIPFLPLILFDFRHDFINFTSFYNFFAGRLQGTSQLNYVTLLAFSFRNIIREIGLFTPWPLAVDYYLLPIFYSLILIHFYSIKNRQAFSLALFPLASLLVLSLYSPPNWPEYYHLSASLLFLISISLLNLELHRTTLLLFVSLAGLFLSLQTLTGPTDPFAYSNKAAAMRYILNTTKPLRPNIQEEFKYGEGLGFLPIREYYQRDFSPEYDFSRVFLLSNSDNPKHNQSAKIFGTFAVSILPPNRQQ